MANRDDETEDWDPYEIEFMPEFRQGRGPRKPFVNAYGVTIGDHDYESANSPLEQWTADTDPFIMAGDEWVHPYKDVGFQTAENRDYFERGIPPQGGVYMHPTRDAAYKYALGQAGDEGHSGEVEGGSAAERRDQGAEAEGQPGE